MALPFAHREGCPGPRGTPCLLLLLLVGLASACDLLSPSVPEPAGIAISPPAITFDAIGATESLSVEVRDRSGSVMADVAVAWSSSDPSVATVSTTGLVRAVGNGSASITATAGAATGSVSVSVSQAGATLVALAGEGQHGAAGEPLGQPLVVRALDRFGEPAAGVRVTFEIEEGGGSVFPEEVSTDAEGRAATTWTLGKRAGEGQSVRSFLSLRVGVGVNFDATAEPGPAAEVRKVSGDGQAGPRLFPLIDPLRVRVEDRFENPVTGVWVDFAVVDGEGSIVPSRVMTSDDGHATAQWTLGASLGSQGVSVSVESLAPATFSAIASNVPDRVEVLAGAGQAGVVGEPLAEVPSVRVLDADDAPVPSIDVRFSVPPGGGVLQPSGGGGDVANLTVRTGPDGIAAIGAWILGTTPGTHTLEVALPVLAPVVLTATARAGPPAAVIKASGDGQTALAGTALAFPVTVEVTDSYGNPVAGATVTFQPMAGSGSILPAQAITGENGSASTRWTLGAATGIQHVRVSIASGAFVVFQARATSPAGTHYSIDLRFVTEPTTSQRQAFTAAVARWEELITGTLEPTHVQLPAGGCGSGSPAINEVVDDLLIIADLDFIDGLGGTLARAGPCVTREANGLPVVGRLTIDTADLGQLEASGRLVDLIIHEIAHVLGFGSLWTQRGLLANPSPSTGAGGDTHFTGREAVAAFDAVGGHAYFGGGKVPVENELGGAGTRNTHWRKSVFDNEVMTGFLSHGANPLSRVTAASLHDLGYQLDLSRVDDYTLSIVAAVEDVLPIGDDIYRGPIYVVDRAGRIREVVTPE